MRHMNSECLAGLFIHHGQHLIRPVITQLVICKIDGPHRVGPIGAHADDGAIFMIQATSAFMALRQLQALFTLKSFDFLVVHLPT